MLRQEEELVNVCSGNKAANEYEKNFPHVPMKIENELKMNWTDVVNGNKSRELVLRLNMCNQR